MATDLYVKKTWKDAPSTETPVNAENLNHLETGVEKNNVGLRAAETNIAANTTAINQINQHLTANSKQFIFDYQDGKWGYNESENRGADTFHPFSELEETDLWENPTPTSNRGAFNATLSDSVQNYKYLRIYYRYSTTATTRSTSILVSVEDYINYKNQSGYMQGGLNCRNPNIQLSRAFWYVNDTTLAFGIGYCMGYGDTANGNCIPLKICGVI